MTTKEVYVSACLYGVTGPNDELRKQLEDMSLAELQMFASFAPCLLEELPCSDSNSSKSTNATGGQGQSTNPNEIT